MVPAVGVIAQESLYLSWMVWVEYFGVGRERGRFSEQKGERRSDWDIEEKLHVSCSLLDPIGSRVF